MPDETDIAIVWAVEQTSEEGNPITTNHEIVDKVREYFNTNVIFYESFGYEDLEPFLPN